MAGGALTGFESFEGEMMKSAILPDRNAPQIIYDTDCQWVLKHSGMFPVKVVRAPEGHQAQDSKENDKES